MVKLKDIVYEKGQYWVLKVKSGFEVYKIGITSSTRCAQIGFTGNEGLKKAKAEIERRENQDNDSIKKSNPKKETGWIVDKDYTEEYDGKTFTIVNVSGPRGVKLTDAELLKGHPFKMFDDDGVLYYTGFYVGDKTSEGAFDPLEHYGTPNAGCTYIQYKNGNKWETL